MKSFLLSLQGRVDRTGFFSYHVLVLGVMLVLGFALSFIPVNLQIGINLLWLLLLWPSFCVSLKRLHDTGHSGRLLWLFVPEIVLSLITQLGIGFAGGLVAGVFNVIAILSHMACWGLILYLALKPGQASDNPYGMSDYGSSGVA